MPKYNAADQYSAEEIVIDEIMKEWIEKKEQILKEIQQSKMELEKLSQEEAFTKEDRNINFFSPNRSKSEERRLEMEGKKEEITKQLSHLEENILETENKISKLTEVKYVLQKKATMEDKHFERSSCIKVLETQEEERQRIARELHDSPVQNLTLLVHKTELCLKLVDIDTIRVKLELQSMIDTIHDTINDMRSIIYDMRPMSLDDLGLVVTVERFVNQMRERTENIKYSFQVVNEEINLPSVVTLTLFRIIQEACNNAVKYAAATEISITIIYLAESIELEIKDNGKGFDLHKIGENENAKYSGFGLSMMKERVYLLSGEIQINTKIERGTVIKVYVPTQDLQQ